MRLPLASLFVCACASYGQGFGQLATNLYGSTLYFSSPMRMKGTAQYLHPKIFVWDKTNGIRLYEQRASDLPYPFPPFGFGGTEYFALTNPDVAADGATLAVTGNRFCNGSDMCVASREEYQSTIYAPGQRAIGVPGTATLSRNGRYALLRSSIPILFLGNANLLDLQTGQQTALMAEWDPPGTRHEHEVANDGTVVLANGQGFSIGQGGKLISISAPLALLQSTPPPNPLINAAASLVVYQAGGGTFGPARLSVYTMATGTSIDLATESAAAPDFRPSISDDASVVAFIDGANRQIYVVAGSGAQPGQIGNFSEPVTEVALSGDGKVAFAVTAANRIARIDLASGMSVDLVLPTPTTSPAGPAVFAPNFGWRFSASRGGAITIQGSGFTADSQGVQPPYPLSLGGVKLQINGSAVPVAAVSPTSVSYPVPWDLPDSPVDVEVWASSAAGSPFVPGFEVEPVAPNFGTKTPNAPGTAIVAAHQDFLSLVSAANPPYPGEYIHVYAQDLGPVTPAPPSGLPAPIEPLAELAVPISCSLFLGTGGISVAVDVSFSGLAPGLLNTFQMDVRMPDSFAQGNPKSLFCFVDYPYTNHQLLGALP
jgi:uncharacterized protein (TIGR03437 family)